MVIMSIKSDKFSGSSSGAPRRLWGPGLATLLVIGLLCGLGNWQWQRMGWKQALIAAQQQAFAAPPVALDYAALDAPGPSGTPGFIKGRVTGRFLSDSAFLFGLRTDEGRPGHHVIAPLALADGGVVLINRGWVPLDYQGPLVPGDEQTVMVLTGIARFPDRPSRFAPENDPARGEWHRLDYKQIKHHFGFAALPARVFYVTGPRAETGDTGFEAGNSLPRPFDRAGWQLPNNHLHYALTWYLLALTLAAVFYARFLHKPRS